MGLTEFILKSRSGVYKDTPENRRKHRVGQRYGETKTQKEQNSSAGNTHSDFEKFVSRNKSFDAKAFKKWEDSTLASFVKWASSGSGDGKAVRGDVRQWGLVAQKELNAREFAAKKQDDADDKAFDEKEYPETAKGCEDLAKDLMEEYDVQHESIDASLNEGDIDEDDAEEMRGELESWHEHWGAMLDEVKAGDADKDVKGLYGGLAGSPKRAA